MIVYNYRLKYQKIKFLFSCQENSIPYDPDAKLLLTGNMEFVNVKL